MFQLTIKTSTCQVAIVDVEVTSTVYELKDKIYKQTGIPIEKQVIRFIRKRMENDKALGHYYIGDGNTLHLRVL